MVRITSLPSDREFSGPRKRRARSRLGQSGTVAVLVAIAAPMLAMAIALGVEISDWTVTKQRVQRTADLAAIAGAAAMSSSASAYNGATYAARVAEMNRPTKSASRSPSSGSFTGTLTDTTDIDTITILSPATAGTPGSVKVTIQTSVPLRFAGIALTGPAKTISATATAAFARAQIGNYCVLALDPSSTTDVTMNNGATVAMSQCGLAVNGLGSTAISMSGGAVLTAKVVSIVGSDSLTNGATINATNGVILGAPAVADPYLNTALPLYSGCDHGSLPSSGLSLGHSNAGLQTLTPGVYCGGLAMTNDANVSMSPGVYIINGGSFNVGGAVILTGTGVTVVLTGSGSNYATLTIGNGANVTLSAPTSGATSGMVFFQDPNAPASGTNNFQGGAHETLTGALYFPHQTVIYSNGTAAAACTQIIAYHIQFTGGSSVQNNCGGTGTSGIGAATSTILTQ